MNQPHTTSSFWMYGAFLLFLVVLFGAGYGAYSLLSNPISYAEQSWKNRHAVETPDDAPTTIATDTDTSVADTTTTVATTTPEPTVTPEPVTPVPTATSNSLQDSLNDLIKRNVILKQGDKGADVGVIQKFMNQYYKTTTRADNDFGANLTALVKKFQTAQKLPVTGQIGPKTLQKMASLAK